MARLTTAATVVGTAAPLILQSQFDQAGNRSLTRTSTLLGLGGGAALLGANYLLGEGIIGSGRPNAMTMDLTMSLGLGLATTGLYSAFFPKGASVGLPAL